MPLDSPPQAEVGLVLYDHCQMSVVHGLSDLFFVANAYSADHGGPHLRISQWRRDGGGFTRVQDSQPGVPGQPDVLIVPGRLTRPSESDDILPHAVWLRDCHARGATLASVCAGAFILGQTGLLDGRPATTHWFFAETFRDRFPRVLLDPERILIEDGDIVTAGGIMAWTDLGLALVHRLLGPTVTSDVSKFLLVDASGREQRHFSRFAPRLTHGDESILKVQHWLQSRAGRDVTIPAMAQQAGMEERTFLRRFKAATGLKPTEYAQNLRIARAREQLEFTRTTVDRIAWDVGYEDPAAFRRVFQKITGLTAGEYRQRFALAGRG